MCGICCVTGKSSDPRLQEHNQYKSRLSNRGPDDSSSCQVQISANYSAVFRGYVLHLRGDQLASQPAKDQLGNLLLWNGEIFSGIQVPEHQSDTLVLLNLLGNCVTDEQILTTFAQIQGPWAFVYWQSAKKVLWFGRDVFGRRSLLWHLPKDHQDVFVLSSVQIKPWNFTEVPSIGIFKMTLKPMAEDMHSHSCYAIDVFTWKMAVWPGTLDKVSEEKNWDQNFKLDIPKDTVTFKLCIEYEVPSQMPMLNKSLPDLDHKFCGLHPSGHHLDYLKEMLMSNSYMKTLCQQLTGALLEAVRARVHNQRHTYAKIHISDQIPKDFVNNGDIDETKQDASFNSASYVMSSATVAILFSGGIDSTVIASLADRCLPKGDTIDLLNVAFELKPKSERTKCRNSISRKIDSHDYKKWNVPDRQTGYTALMELNPDRRWNFIEVNVTAEELNQARAAHIQDLVYPLQTVLDDSIACAVWFASRGSGVLGNGPDRGTKIQSQAKVILCGMGADEQLVGYSRHRGIFKEEGWPGLIDEIELEITRISSRNLGRDDRIIADHGKEARFPFLDERVVQFLSSLPIHFKADLTLPRGLGEKLLLRLCATELGLNQTATLAKRAIQFGSRIAKLENSKEKASDICQRLTCVTTKDDFTAGYTD